MTEEWRDVVDGPGYQVSNLGRVRSVDRIVKTKRGSRTYPGRLLRPATDTGRVPYLMVKLGTRGGWRRTRRVHVLVAEAFLGPRPEGLICCHRNDDPQDNRAENLRWGTYASNTAEAATNGRTIGRPKALHFGGRG